jgi:probable rRNA maturation factor
MKPPSAAPDSLRVSLQVVARRPWAPAPVAVRRWARAAHAAGLETLSPRARKSLPAGRAHLCVRIVGRAESRRLDRDYRGKDKPTNVLSFPASAAERDADAAIGDLVICAPVVAAEAKEQGKALDAHWAHMVVHGTLHLLGFDHVSARRARVMERLEVEILGRFRYPDPYRTESGSLA